MARSFACSKVELSEEDGAAETDASVTGSTGAEVSVWTGGSVCCCMDACCPEVPVEEDAFFGEVLLLKSVCELIKTATPTTSTRVQRTTIR